MGLNKQALINMMSYPNEISDREVDELNNILSEYPYFQLGHALLAKARHDKQTPDAYASLSHAAIYAPDRHMLRKLFYESLSIEKNTLAASGTETPISEPENINAQPEAPAVTTDLPVPEKYEPPLGEEESPDFSSDQVISSDKVYQELQENLEQLRRNRNKFDQEDQDTEPGKKKIAEQNDDSNKQHLLQAERPRDEDEPAADQAEKGTTAKEDNSPSSILLQDLAHERISPVLDVNQQRQNELIDRFINSNVDLVQNIKKNAASSGEHADLSSSSTEANDNLISENLADILLRQGKTEKAVEIYKKLIWKYPQKKTYFADKINQIKAD
ncbi:MAG: tetratricopeptide repeat protein [Cyclobacteriaceae bacterium]